MKRFEIIDHPSDIGIVAFGKDRKELFENAAYGMFSLMADLSKVSTKQKLDIQVKGDDPEDLLVNWLNELIFNEDAKKMLFNVFRIKKMTGTELEAEVEGERIDPKTHEIHRPIKAATFSQLQIGTNQAKIIFDV